MSWFKDKIPETAKAFTELRDATYKDGALDSKTKELISIAASVLMRCEECIEIHTTRARKHGVTDEQIAEAISCAMFVAAGSQLSWSPIYDSFIFNDKEEKNKDEKK